MQIFHLFLVFYIALSYASEDTEGDQEPDLQRDLQQFLRRLTQQQLQTTQQVQSAFLPQLNIPVPRARSEEGSEDGNAAFGLFKFPFQSNIGREGAHSFASSSASVKRPRAGADASVVAYASVQDVNEEEQAAENLGLSQNIHDISSEYIKTSATPSEMQPTSVADNSGKTGPYALKHRQTDPVVTAEDSFSDAYFVAIVAGCCAIGIFGVISAGICFYRLQKSRKAAADVDYPAYGVTGPSKDISSPNGDRKLAQSAQMYHYQHQKQQMIAVEKAGSTKNTSASDVDSEEENEEGDYTVYECPGLAPTGEMEVKNPLFHDDSTPVSPPVLPAKSDSNQNN